MPSNLINPLQQFITKSAITLPKATGAVVQYEERLKRINGGKTVILADVSGSMQSTAWGGRTKHQVLRDAIAATMRRAKYELIAFSSQARLLDDPAQLPEPNGTTAMHLALQAAMMRDPGRILVISDGEPDDEYAAVATAKLFKGVIDVLYIGPDSNAAAMAFLRRLAKSGYGIYRGSDIARAGQAELTHTLGHLLLEGTK